MKINVKATNFALTESLSQYLDDKLSKLKKYLDESKAEVMVNVEIGKTTEHHRHGDVFKAEINLDLAGQGLKRSVVVDEDVYVAIILARDEVIRQIKTSQRKKGALFMKGARKIKEMLRFWA